MSSSFAPSLISAGESSSSVNHSQEPPLEVKKDGTASKMRLHKGNIPSVPQTKPCPLCPAKFTRTTHLSRHLRTHTREKLHECDKCHSQFTRSDLLTRHKRSCGDQGMSRSRRKSCQACAESKVKCDLQHPCSKCRTRGRDCVYIGGHNVASSSASGDNPSARRSEDLEAELLAMLDTATIPAEAHGPMGPVSLPNSYLDMMRTSAVRSGSPHVTATSISSFSPFTPASETPVAFSIDSLATFARIDQTAPPPESQFDEVMQNGMFGDFFGSIFTPGRQALPPTYNSAAASSKKSPMDGGVFDNDGSIWDPGFPFSITAPMDLHRDAPLLSQGSPSLSSATSYSSPAATDAATSTSSAPVSRSAPSSPSPAELQTYVSLFYSAFSPNMPIVHAATFDLEGKSPLLAAAMQACGALYVKTRTAMNFIDSVLARARDELVVELAKESVNWEHQINLALAVCLFQTLGLFHRNPEQRAFSNVYHGMLAMMFRLNGFSRATFDWVPPTDIDHASAPRLWREWAQHETAKRALAVSYLHDCCHCIYFNLRPTYDTTDFDMRLPCEDALWTASTADEWLQLLRQPSRYGSIQERLRGPMLRATYDKLAEPESVSATPLVLNPWSHNILIHVALRQFFEEFLEARLPEIGTPRASSPSRRDTQYISDERIAELQLIMHNWLQSWLHSPESPTYNAREPRFMNQALPYYWFSQVAILAYQERLPPFCTSTTFVVSGEAKFRLMKKWERHIRKFLRRGGTEPTVFLDDLIKTRMRKWDSSGLVEDAEEDPVHLLGFFPGT